MTEEVATTKTTAIAGYKFSVAMPYAEGHTVTAAEASVLNQTRAENIGNNLRGKIKEAIDAVEGDLNPKQIEKLQSVVTEYDDKYKLEAKRPAQPRITDPVEKEARKLARAAINAALKGKDLKRKDLDEAILTKLAAKEDELCVKGSKIWKAAEANVKKQEEAIKDAGILDDLGVAAE